MTAPRPTVTGDTTQLAAPPDRYEQHDESQTRREIERSFSSVNKRLDAIEDVILAQVVTDGIITQTSSPEILVLVAGIPTPMAFPTTLQTVVPRRWSMPTDGTLRYTGTQFARLGLTFGFFEMSPDTNNRTFIVDFLVNDVIGRTYEFQTGTAGLFYPVAISGLIDLLVGTTDTRLQITCTTSVTITVQEWLIEAADFFSASAFDFDDPSGAQSSVPIVTGPTMLRSLLNNAAQLLGSGVLDPEGANLNRHLVPGPMGALATGYAQQRGSGTITIPAVDTWVAFDPVTTLGVNSTQWTQSADAELTLITDTKRICQINLVTILDTAAANQEFDFRLLLNGTPLGTTPYMIPLVGNAPQEQSLGFLVELPIGETTLSLEVRNTISGQDLTVIDFAMSISDNLADG